MMELGRNAANSHCVPNRRTANAGGAVDNLQVASLSDLWDILLGVMRQLDYKEVRLFSGSVNTGDRDVPTPVDIALSVISAEVTAFQRKLFLRRFSVDVCKIVHIL